MPLQKLPDHVKFSNYAAALKAEQDLLLISTWKSGHFTAKWDEAVPEKAAVDAKVLSMMALPPAVAATEVRSRIGPGTDQLAPVHRSITITKKVDPTLTAAPTNLKSDYKIRMLQFARAAIFALDYQEPELLDEAKTAAANSIYECTQLALTMIDSGSADAAAPYSRTVFATLATELGKATSISDYKKAEKQLLIAEQLLTWHDGRVEQTNICSMTITGNTFTINRTEKPITLLTDTQKAEYLKIHNEPKPLWFKALNRLIQNYLLETVPDHNELDMEAQDLIKQDKYWNTIEHTIPATLRGVPGLANFTRHTTTITTTANASASSTTITSYKSSTPPPIDLMAMDSSEERIRLTMQNIEQYIETRISDDASQNTFYINTLLNELFGEDLLYQTGLDLRVGHKDSNTRFISEIREAVKRLKKIHPDWIIITSSTPINNGRYLLITKNTHDPAQDQRLIELPVASHDALKPVENIAEAILPEAKKALQQLSNSVDYFGDLNLLRAALYEIIIPGALSGCKSGKDRELYKQDYAVALRAYYAAYTHFPDFNLPKRSPTRLMNFLAYLGLTALAVAGIATFLIPGMLPLLGLIGLVAGGGALALAGIGYHLFTQPNYTERANFLRILRQIRLSGFGAMSASLNAPGVYGQKDEDISPSDLINPRLAQFPFRGKAQFKTKAIDLGIYLTASGGLATAAYFLLTHFLVLPGPLFFALPMLLAAVVAVPFITKMVGSVAMYYLSPVAKDKEAIESFRRAHTDGKLLAEGNKYKGNKYKGIKYKGSEDKDVLAAANPKPLAGNPAIQQPPDTTPPNDDPTWFAEKPPENEKKAEGKVPDSGTFTGTLNLERASSTQPAPPHSSFG